MIKKCLVVAAVLCTTIGLLTGCGEKQADRSNDIVVVHMYENNANSYQCRGEYLTAGGNWYAFDFTKDVSSEETDDDTNSEESTTAASTTEAPDSNKTYTLDDVIAIPVDKRGEPVDSYDAETMNIIATRWNEVQKEPEFDSVKNSVDAGEDVYYKAYKDKDGKYQYIKLGAVGDQVDVPKDKNVYTLCQLLGLDFDIIDKSLFQEKEQSSTEEPAPNPAPDVIG